MAGQAAGLVASHAASASSCGSCPRVCEEKLRRCEWGWCTVYELVCGRMANAETGMRTKMHLRASSKNAVHLDNASVGDAPAASAPEMEHEEKVRELTRRGGLLMMRELPVWSKEEPLAIEAAPSAVGYGERVRRRRPSGAGGSSAAHGCSGMSSRSVCCVAAILAINASGSALMLDPERLRAAGAGAAAEGTTCAFELGFLRSLTIWAVA